MAKIYLQKQGTAMGTRMAPNYAIIFMHAVEEEILNNTKPETQNLAEIYRRCLHCMDIWKGKTGRIP